MDRGTWVRVNVEGNLAMIPLKELRVALTLYSVALYYLQPSHSQGRSGWLMLLLLTPFSS